MKLSLLRALLMRWQPRVVGVSQEEADRNHNLGVPDELWRGILGAEADDDLVTGTEVAENITVLMS